MSEPLDPTRVVLGAWLATCQLVSASRAAFAGPDKERRVILELRDQIQRAVQGTGEVSPNLEVKCGTRFIDLLWGPGSERIAVEGKYKVLGDGAVPDNRKAAFYDLFKLEHYVDSGSCTSGLFLWLTDQPAYLREAKGDSAEFSTHEGRVYRAGTPLWTTRSRNSMPIPLKLKRDFVFRWEPISPDGWQSLVLRVERS
jgi:hypothetical protein